MNQRVDPYQARARELCLAAGVEPDSRIGEGRGQPAWCTFRDVSPLNPLSDRTLNPRQEHGLAFV